MLCITKAIRVENQIAAIEKEIRDMLEGLAREQPASRMKRLGAVQNKKMGTK
jgi:transposase